ncbi:MAG: branched-chain amino acid aminotransferase [Lentisphaeria bacterium]|nr:branched-chain amino acid aminotransferase [Lentisphaeria bacterium]
MLSENPKKVLVLLMTMDWSKLSFAYQDTNCHIRYTWKNGQWDRGELVKSPYINLHIAATALHYGQAAFEGMKAFRDKAGNVRVFRAEMNAARINSSARQIMMAEIPEDLFMDAVKRVVKANMEFVPPYGTGATLYIRPLLFGSGPQIGVNPAKEYTFIILVTPVGAYYKGGLTPMRAIVFDDHDRAAPFGTGHVKLGGNYAASLLPHHLAHEAGFPMDLYLDPVEHKYVEEFGTSNFLAITKDGKYVTSKSPSILPSVTNDGLCKLAEHLGMPVERRRIAFEELETFAEIAACGTAVVITPVNEIVRGSKVIKVGPREGCGPVLQNLYNHYTAIQWGDEKDVFAWLTPID